MPKPHCFYWIGNQLYVAARDEFGYWQVHAFYGPLSDLVVHGVPEVSRDTARSMGWPS